MLTVVQTIERKDISGKTEKWEKLVAYDKAVAARVGRCIMVRRTLCGLSSHQLAARLGISAADVHAYETGAKRISAKLLLETAKILGTRPAFFFQ